MRSEKSQTEEDVGGGEEVWNDKTLKRRRLKKK